MFRRTPLSWFQVTRDKTRLMVALAGIAFADILMLIQLGFQDALYESTMKVHQNFRADLVLINPKFETLVSVQSFPRERLYQALSVEGVESVSPVYIGTADWRNPENRNSRAILVFGMNPANPAFDLPEVKQNASQLQQLNAVLFDSASRPEYGAIAETFQKQGIVETEVSDQVIKVSGLFTIGASFAADGNLITSDSTFMNLFKDRQPEKIDVGLLHLKPGTDPEKVIKSLTLVLPNDVRILTREKFAEVERTYWQDSTPIGFIFGLGVIVGFIVGTVIVYQILYSDVSDHLPEYATLKAMGYNDLYLIGVLIQEALFLAILGYIPAYFLSIGLYQLAYMATLLPIRMTLERSIVVLILTIIMCTISGVISMRKLQSADPADVF